MGNPIVIGANPARLRDYFSDLFGWTYQENAPVDSEVSDENSYVFIDRMTTEDGTGIPGGIGGGEGFTGHAVFYVGVPAVEAALIKAEELGGARVMGPVTNTGGGVGVGHFTDPEGNLIGVAGPA